MERFREINQVTLGLNLESNLGISDSSAGVLTLMLLREGNGRYGLFLVDHGSSFKDENQIIYLDLGSSPRGMISAPWNSLYSDRLGADLDINFWRWCSPTFTFYKEKTKAQRKLSACLKQLTGPEHGRHTALTSYPVILTYTPGRTDQWMVL